MAYQIIRTDNDMWWTGTRWTTHRHQAAWYTRREARALANRLPEPCEAVTDEAADEIDWQSKSLT